jgi:hypothetical protein
MSDLSVFDKKNTVVEEGLMYYIIPVNYPLFKATYTLKKGDILRLQVNKPYFFGLKNMTPGYIDDYEEEYGVIFEFKTTREYRLLCLDDKNTVDVLYRDASERIKYILERNYGYMSGIRNSESDNDRELSAYLCSLGKDGYSVHNMKTEGDGIFHTELMLCNSDGIAYVGQVTDDIKVEGIIERGKLKELSKRMEEERKEKKRAKKEKREELSISRMRLDDEEEIQFTPFRMNLNMVTPPRSPDNDIIKTPSTIVTKKRLFDYDEEEVNGGKRKTKRRKRTKRTKKRRGRR